MVQSGLAPDDKIIVAGLQKIFHPGMPVAPNEVPMDTLSTAPTAPAAVAGEVRDATVDFSKFFIDRPIFAAVLSIVIFVAGLIAIPILPISEYPDVVPPAVIVRATYPGANPKVIAETVSTPLEEQINGVENMMYMKSVAGSDGVLQMTITFAPGTDPERCAGAGAEPREPGAVAAAVGGRQSGVTTQKQSPTFLMMVQLLSPTARTTRSTCATTPTSRSRMNWLDCPASARCRFSAAATMRCASGSTRTRSRRAG